MLRGISTAKLLQGRSRTLLPQLLPASWSANTQALARLGGNSALRASARSAGHMQQAAAAAGKGELPSPLLPRRARIAVGQMTSGSDQAANFAVCKQLAQVCWRRSSMQ